MGWTVGTVHPIRLCGRTLVRYFPSGEPPMATELPPPLFPSSLCHGCERMRPVDTGHSLFLRCTDPSLPRYPRQPVFRCPSYRLAVLSEAPAVPPGSTRRA
jgi:hypothetical protein